ncbi:MAG TPA: hypothetical protein VN765_13335 [Candidatus Acidoferrum sp.]|nr:hypothetical protein [Candidatus Acidoferrum sp.]
MKSRSNKPQKPPRFLNVDLQIVSPSKLELLSLLRAFSKGVFVLHSGPWVGGRKHFARLENSSDHKGPDAHIHALCSEVEHLPAKARHLWEASRKEFDVGYELHASEHCSFFTLRPDTLQRMAALGVNLTVTFYQGED